MLSRKLIDIEGIVFFRIRVGLLLGGDDRVKFWCWGKMWR